jgi:electron transfer flavoprotein beta subunit
MRIVVPVKQGIDPKTVKISRSREELDLREARPQTQPEDKYALEAALRIRAAQACIEDCANEVIVIVVGGRSAEDTAREAVAMGADKAVWIVHKGQRSGRTVTALVRAAIARLGGADLVLVGQGGDLDTAGPLAGRLAAALGWPLVLDALHFDVEPAGLYAISAFEGRAARVPVALPAVGEVIPAAERPRYPHPSRIAVAWNDGYVEVWPAAEMGVADEALAADAEMGGLVLGAERQRGQVIGGAPAQAAEELAGILRGKRLLRDRL